MTDPREQLDDCPAEVRDRLLELAEVYEPAIDDLPESFWDTRYARQTLGKYAGGNE